MDISRSKLKFVHVVTSGQWALANWLHFWKFWQEHMLQHWTCTYTSIMTMGCSNHYYDVIMGPIASQITSLTIVYSIVYSDTDQRKHQSSASLAFVRGIHRGPVNSPHKWPVTRKMFPFDDIIMYGENTDVEVILQMHFSNSFYELIYRALHMKLVLDECHRTRLTVS